MKLPSANDEYANVKYCSMIEGVMKAANLYYSHHIDLTKRLNRTNPPSFTTRLSLRASF